MKVRTNSKLAEVMKDDGINCSVSKTEPGNGSNYSGAVVRDGSATNVSGEKAELAEMGCFSEQHRAQSGARAVRTQKCCSFKSNKGNESVLSESWIDGER